MSIDGSLKYTKFAKLRIPDIYKEADSCKRQHRYFGDFGFTDCYT